MPKPVSRTSPVAPSIVGRLDVLVDEAALVELAQSLAIPVAVRKKRPTALR